MKVYTRIPNNPIVSSLCIFVIIIVVMYIIRVYEKRNENFTIPASQYLVNTNMYPYEPTCHTLVNKINPQVLSTLTEAEIATLQSFKNNTYMVDDTLYGTQQCIIPESQLNDNKISGSCVLEKSTLTLEKNGVTSSPEYTTPTSVAWTVPNGCVITKDMIMGQLKSIMSKIEENKTAALVSANAQLASIAQGNATQSKSLDDQTREYAKTTEKNNDYALDAMEVKGQKEYEASQEEGKSASLTNQATQYSVEATQATEFNNYLNDKLIGIRWYAFQDYFLQELANNSNRSNVQNAYNKANTYLDNIWAGKIIPYDGGIVDKIDDYIGMTDKSASYKQYNLTNAVTYVWEFLFRPDVNGIWSFELGSDDASYLCMYRDDQSGVVPRTTSIFGTNVNFMRVCDPGGVANCGSSSVSYMMTINNGDNHGFITKTGTTIESLIAGRLYKVMIVQGNHSGGGGNYQGCRLRVKRPGSTQWYILENGVTGIGIQEPSSWKNKYLTFCYPKRGMFAKVYEGYYNDDLNFFRNRKPVAAVRLQEAYNMYQGWVGSSLPGHGINMTRSWANRPELVKSINNLSTNPQQVGLYPQGYDNWPWWWWDNSLTTVRTISFFGYFKAPVTGRYRFFFAGDDAIYIWFGTRSKEKIVSGLSNSFDVSQGTQAGGPGFMQSIPGGHGTISRPIVVTLDAGSITPIRFVQGDGGGGNTIVFGYELPNGENVYDLTRDFYF